MLTGVEQSMTVLNLILTHAYSGVQMSRSIIIAMAIVLVTLHALPVLAAARGDFAALEWKSGSKSVSPARPTMRVAEAPTQVSDDSTKIAIDQSIEDVITALGPPNKIIVLGSKTLYIYPTLRIQFLNGKVDNIGHVKPAASAWPALVLLPLQSIGHAPKAVAWLDITSTWSGLGRGTKTELFIWKDGNEFYLRNSIPVDEDAYHLTNENAENTSIGADLIESLVKALDAPFRAAPSLEALGITPEWLKANAHVIAQEASSTSTNIRSFDGQTVFIPAKEIEPVFADPVAMEKFAEGLFRTFHTDDYPHLQVNIAYQDGTRDSISTRSQSPMLLPWIVQSDGKAAKTYDGAISRAVAALMPATATNRERLSSDYLGEALSESVVMDLRLRAQLKDVENHSGDALQRLRAKYTVDSAVITNSPAPLSNRLDREHEYLHAILTNSSSLRNIAEAASLPLKRGRVQDMDAFLRSAASFEKLVESVPWLNAYMQENQKTPFCLSIVNNASLDDETLKQFEADMQAIGKQSLIPKVKADKDKIVLLLEGSGFPLSQWLIFPDGRMILWKFNVLGRDRTNVLRWRVSEFPWKPCAVLPTMAFVHCAGQVILPSGVLEPTQ